MDDPINSSSPQELPVVDQTTPELSTQYMVRHNNTIVGIFENQLDAIDAKNGYQMQNEIQFDDTLDILQVL